MKLGPSFFLALVAFALASGCGGSVVSGPSAVLGGVWKLQSIETAGGLLGVARPENYTVEFRNATELSAKADCNACGGGYSVSGASLQVGALACTRAFCGSASNDVVFLSLLTSASSFGVRGVELSIDGSKGTLRFTR